MKAGVRDTDGDGPRPHTTDVVMVEGLVDLLSSGQPVVRADVVAAAKARLADGEHPSAETLAGTLVEGLVTPRTR